MEMDTIDEHAQGTDAGTPSTAPRRPRKHKDGKGRNRPRASLACLNCRERKTKCTKTSDPHTCASCQALQIPCVISQLGDRRRVQSREQFVELQDRVHQLENLLAEQARHNGGAPANTPPDEPFGETHDLPDSDISLTRHIGNGETVVETSSVRRASRAEQHSFIPPNDDQFNVPQEMGAQPSQQQLDPTDWPLDLGAPPFGNAGDTVMQNRPDQRRHSVAFPVQQSPSRSTISAEEDAPRLDFDQENGQSRFYGPTSQLHTRSHSHPNNAEMESANAPLAEIKLDSTRVQEILLHHYWESQVLSQAIIDREKFEAGRKVGQRSEYWSPFLENALFACASRMRTSFDIRALGPGYCERATHRIIEELQSPQIATIQGFLLLSDYEATRGRDRLGYLYCGIGCRMIFDLGLHESCNALVEQGRLTAADKISRHLLFLGAYVYDTLWGLYLGRPSSIPATMLHAARNRDDDFKNSIPTSLEAWVGLATEIAEATEVLNSNAVPMGPIAMEQLHDLDSRIARRTETLDPKLSFHAGQISELAIDAYGLHIQLRGIRIVLHKRLTQTMLANAEDLLPSQSPELARSRAIMHENAVMIAKLTSTYQRIFGIENVITVMLDNMFVAAALLVSHVLNIERTEPSQSTEGDLGWLYCLSEMFKTAQRHYPVTSRMLSTLSNLVQGTSMAGIFGERTHSKPSAAQMVASSNDMAPAGTDWSMGLGLDMNQQESQQPDPSNWFLDGLGDPNMGTAPDMDPRNMMSWLLSPMEEM